MAVQVKDVDESEARGVAFVVPHGLSPEDREDARASIRVVRQDTVLFCPVTREQALELGEAMVLFAQTGSIDDSPTSIRPLDVFRQSLSPDERF